MHIHSKRFFYYASLCATAYLLSACGGNDDIDTSVESDQPIELTILHINDHHSNLAEKSTTLKLNTGQGIKDVKVSAAGFPRITQTIEELAAKSKNVIKIHSGDAITGTLFFNRAGEDGEADAALMRTVCFDTFTLGNHEFDKGDSGLKKFLDFLNGAPCNTQALSANVNFGASSALHPERAPNVVKRSVVLQRSGQKFGLIGLTIAEKTKIASSPDPDTTFENEVTAAQREIDALKAQGINKIIVQSHIGYNYDKELIAKLSGVDVVVGGDSHTLLGPDTLKTYGVGSPAGAYPTQLKDKEGNLVCLVQAWEYSQVVGELKVKFDGNGKVTQCHGTPHVLIGDDFKIDDTNATAEQNAAIRAVIEKSNFLRITQPSTKATEVLAPFAKKIEAFNEKYVATAQQELCNRRVPGGQGSMDFSRSSISCNTLGEVSKRGGDIQQIVAQAYLEVSRDEYGGADISLQSAGGVRIPLLPGDATAADIIKVLPFGNMLYRIELTGSEIKSTIEDGLDAVFKNGGTTGPYPYTGGLKFDVNANNPKSERASNLEVRNAQTGEWEALDPDRLYYLAVLSFNASGGDGYFTLRDLPKERVLDVGVLDSDVLFKYIEKQAKDPITGFPILNKLPDELYSTKLFIGPAVHK